MEKTRRMQLLILKIIKYIDELCVKNSIDYYLLAGSSLGAVRHKGFIPWDDDLDIVMTVDNYNQFVEVCKYQIDTKSFYFQQGEKDWPLPFSKIRLKGTYIREIENCDLEKCNQGIFVDIFRLDNVSNNRCIAWWQYFCSKVFLTYSLRERKYTSASLKKKILIYFSFPLKIKSIRQFFKRQVEKYNNRETDYYGFFYGRSKHKNAIMRKNIYGTPQRMPFEDMFLPVQENVHEYLSIFYGDYMQLPPEKDQIGLHALEIDFGKY